MLDASVYNDDSLTASFHAMIRVAANTSTAAVPTPFHLFVAELAREGRLLRLYTQNIDDLDARLGTLATVRPLPQHAPWPKTIQLHGSLSTAICATCSTLSPLEPTQFEGPSPPECCNCKEKDEALKSAGKRSRGIGRLRPRITLYNEAATDAEAIGQVMATDLCHNPDAVIVAGTSLKIPRVKRFVEELCSVTRRNGGLTAWVNVAAEPARMKGTWDFVLCESSDTLGRAGVESKGVD